MEERAITTVEELLEYGKGAVVELPPFSESQPFVAKMRRPSVVKLAAEGFIPNALIPTALALFTAGEDKEEQDALKRMNNLSDVLTVIAKASLISPTYEDIEKAGLALTDNQLLAIYQYTQMGVENLKFFRAD